MWAIYRAPSGAIFHPHSETRFSIMVLLKAIEGSADGEAHTFIGVADIHSGHGR